MRLHRCGQQVHHRAERGRRHRGQAYGRRLLEIGQSTIRDRQFIGAPALGHKMGRTGRPARSSGRTSSNQALRGAVLPVVRGAAVCGSRLQFGQFTVLRGGVDGDPGILQDVARSEDRHWHTVDALSSAFLDAHRLPSSLPSPFVERGGKGRLRTMTAEERQRSARRAVLARWRKTPAEERSEAARWAVLARWARAAKKKAPKTGGG